MILVDVGKSPSSGKINITNNNLLVEGKSLIKLHNLFVINVGPVIIVTVACQLTGCRPHGNTMF